MNIGKLKFIEKYLDIQNFYKVTYMVVTLKIL